MTLAVPLSVRLRTARRDVHIGREVHDLSFRSASPGGFASCTVALDRPLTLQPDEIAAFGRLYVYDARSGATVWEGRLEDPGRTAGDGGQVWDLTAIGPSAHAQDRTRPYVVVDTNLEQWVRSSVNQHSAQTGTIDEDAPALELVAPEGSTPTAGSVWADMVYIGLDGTGLELGRVRAQVTCGGTTATYEARLVTRAGAGAGTLLNSGTFDTTPFVLSGFTGSGTAPIPAGHNRVSARIQRVSGTTAASANIWAEFDGVTVRTLLKTKAGVDDTTGLTVNTVTADRVVADLLGRFLTSYDGANATIDVGSYAIDQLTYPDGVTPQAVLDDLMALEPAYTWAAWESNASDLYRFEWTAWPTTVRYEADVTDGFDSPGSAEGLYNAVTSRWKTASGRPVTARSTSTVPDLVNAIGGTLVREALIDLGDEIGSAAGAAQARTQFLAEHATPPNAGSLTIARPIADLQAGRYVMPWEIRPGNLIRVRGVLPRVDSLNATARDGVTVFKIAASDYNQGSNSASLELDSYPLSVARAIATASRRPVRRRR